MNYLPVDYYGNPDHLFDDLSVVKNFNQLYVPCVDGFLTEEDMAKKPNATVLVLDTMADGYKRFKVKGVPGTMKGYGFVYSSDARFNRHFGRYPIALHDRKE